MPKYFPIFRNMENEKVVIIGNNKSAQLKAEKLLDYDIKAELISQKILNPAEFISRHSPKMIIVADYDLVDVKKLYSLCIENRIEINTVDKPNFCTFIFPSLISRENLTIAVSTNGKSPAAAIKIRQKIESNLPLEVDEIIQWLWDIREDLKCQSDIDKKRLAKIMLALADKALDNGLASIDIDDVM